MSIKKLYSNELLASFEYSNIDKDYDFYYVTTSDKYIKGGATFLDIDDIKISALQFESGKSFWVMLPKNAISRAEFVRLLNAKEDGDSLSIKSMTSSSIPEYLLTQLFLNALTSPVDEMISFNNLSGKLLCFRPAWLNKDKENFIWGMQCLEVKVGDDMCVNLVAHRMTSLALKKQMKFEKRKLQDYPQYEFSYNNNTLKRVSNENKDRRENFIIKPVDGERGSITFFDFTDYETFSCTKMGVLYDILNALHDEFGKYIRVKFKQYSIDEVLEYKRVSLELYKDIVKKEVLNSGINIVDVVHSETSEDYLQDVADGINKIIPEAKCSVGKRLSKKKLNVRYIHDKFFYSDSEVDPHQESMEDYVVQHITVENFKHQSSAAVYNILKELVIKKDIATGKITLVDWSQYGYKADWLFGVVLDGTYYSMTIHPDGSFKIEALKRNLFNMTEYDKYMDYFGLNEENKNDYRGVIGLVKDAEGNINLIKDTNMYSMPDYTAMGDVLKNVASEGRFPGKDVVTWLRLVMDTTDKIKVHAELDIVIPHIDVNAEYTKANVMGLFKGITTKKEVVRYVFENTGIMLYAYLRGEEERREYLSGNIDINYFDYDDTHVKYSVGEIGNGMKYTIERASVVREIQAVEGSKLIFKKVLPLMGVEFVRYGMLTVVPFPFKYLREYIVKEEKSV
ncbi:Uncharacterised protein [uncultured Clostridium sp.]|nr:Uncharacterised protein [uncultured Clostridium sp.]